MTSLGGPGGPGFQVKSFWDRNEGKVGRGIILLLLGALGVAAIQLWAKILPFLIQVTSNTIYLVGLIVALIIFVRVVLSDRFRIGVWAFFQWISMMIGRVFYPIGAEAIMRAFVADRKKKQAKAEEGTEKLKGTIKRAQSRIERALQERDREMRLAQTGQRQLKGTELGEEQRIRLTYATKLSAMRAGMLKETAVTLTTLQHELERYYKIMLRLTAAGQFIVAYYEEQVRNILLRREGVNEAHAAMRNVRAIMKGDALSEVYDEVVEHVMGEMEQKLGEIDGFYDNAQAFLSKLDLEHGVFEEDTFAELQKLATKVESTLGEMDRHTTAGGEFVFDEDIPQQQGGSTSREPGDIRSISDLLGDDKL